MLKCISIQKNTEKKISIKELGASEIVETNNPSINSLLKLK